MADATVVAVSAGHHPEPGVGQLLTTAHEPRGPNTSIPTTAPGSSTRATCRLLGGVVLAIVIAQGCTDRSEPNATRSVPPPATDGGTAASSAPRRRAGPGPDGSGGRRGLQERLRPYECRGGCKRSRRAGACCGAAAWSRIGRQPMRLEGSDDGLHGEHWHARGPSWHSEIPTSPTQHPDSQITPSGRVPPQQRSKCQMLEHRPCSAAWHRRFCGWDLRRDPPSSVDGRAAHRSGKAGHRQNLERSPHA